MITKIVTRNTFKLRHDQYAAAENQGLSQSASMDTNRKNYSDDHEQQRPIITFSQALATQLQYFDQVQRVYFWQENKLIQKQAAAYELQEQLDEACRRVEELECQKYLQRRNEQKLERQVEDFLMSIKRVRYCL